jgi:uncharacterized protein
VSVPGGGAAGRARTRIDVEVAGRVIGPLWPLRNFIAVNPLDGLVEMGFEGAAAQAQRWLRARCFPDAGWLRAAHHAGRITDADLWASVRARHPGLGDDEVAVFVSELLERPVARPAPAPRTASERCDELLGTDVAATVDAMVATWCAAFVDEGSAAWPMPGRGAGLYRAWRRLAPHDPGLRRLVGRHARAELRRLPEHPEDAIVEALEGLGVAPESYRDELRGQLCRLPGWAGYARWREEWTAPDDPAPRLSIVDLVAVRLVYERLAVRATTGTPGAAPATDPQPDRQAVDERAAVWLDAYERHYRDELLAALARPAPPPPVRPPAAQLVCCIDARSEGLRRHLEAVGDYETLGFAGFFGVPIRFRPLGAPGVRAQCPVLVTPRVGIEERPILGQERLGERQLARWRAAAAAGSALHAAKTGTGAAFTLAEVSGWVNGPVAAARTLRPRRRVRTERPSRLRTAPTVDANANADGLGFTLDEQVLYAETALVTMGLTGGFAPLVLLCGHGGRTTNNPHASALDCGACGGNPGGPNARVAAVILNHPDVREGLRERGIDIPPSTWFLAGEHDTTTDTVVILDRHAVPPHRAGAVAAIEGDLAAAGRRLAAERFRALPGGHDRRPAAHAAARAHDWAEVRPEWGLARNTAFIVAPRSMTVGLDLGCRTFLHSYDAAVDPDGTALETILTAPMVVAQWINAQYYFSTVDPDVFGAGDKTLHNPVGGIGVLVGGGGDLRGGLPRQSVLDGDDPYHEPMRLLAVVEAPLERITAVVDRNGVLRHLFDGGWVTLAARAHPAAPWQLRCRDGTWAPWQPAVPADDQTEVPA